MVAGRAATPTDEERAAKLKAYWATGKGREEWIHDPHPWTTLRNLLLKYVSANAAAGLASNIFKLATGHYPSQRDKGERL